MLIKFFIKIFLFLEIKPKEPSDQYGYFTEKKFNKVSNFIEKPSKLVAKKYN